MASFYFLYNLTKCIHFAQNPEVHKEVHYLHYYSKIKMFIFSLKKF